MSCRIDRVVRAENVVVLFISGRITGEDVDMLRGVLEQESGGFAIDLKNVLLVDSEGVNLLAVSESNGTELRNCPPISVSGSRERGRKCMGAHRSKDKKEGRTSKMHSMHRGGLHIRMQERVNERTRIARDLHDTLLQSFQAVVLNLAAVPYAIQDRPAEAAGMVERIAEQARQAVTEGRDAILGLRSSTVDTNDLIKAIATFGEGLASDEPGGKSAYFRVDLEGASMDLAPLIRDEVYRIVAEALRNAFRHADARRIEVKIRYDKRRLRIVVQDDGRGIAAQFLSAGRTGHHGLTGMYERAQLVGGKVTVWSELDSGTQIELSIPGSVAYAKVMVPRGSKALGQGVG